MRTSEICRQLGPKQTANLSTPATAASPIADAPRKNWVDRFAPQKLRPWLWLMRADRPIGVVAPALAVLVVGGSRVAGGRCLS